jgi:hemerythrin superfamily protein
VPNALDLLTGDHRLVEQLFGEFQDTGDEQVAFQICDELTVHTSVEEQAVYPSLRELDGDLAAEAEQEHTEAKQLIERVRSASGDQLVELMDELEQAVMHHVQEEEGQAFPKLQELGEERLAEMGDAIEALKASGRAA